MNHYVSSSGTIANVAGRRLRIEQKTDYPWKGEVSLTLEPEQAADFTVRLRIPNRGETPLYHPTPANGPFEVRVNGQVQPVGATSGYVSLTRAWKPGDTIELVLPMPVQRVHADERVESDRGRVALQRGPIVYSVESVDHKHDIRSLFLPKESQIQAVWKPDLLGGVMVLEATAVENRPAGIAPAELVAIPNFARLNRGGWSQVWIAEDPQMTAQFLEPKSGVYRIAAMHTRKPWGVAGSSTEAGAQVQQESPSDARSQLWQIGMIEPGCFKIVNAHSGLALTVSDGSEANNALMRQAPYEGKAYQQFTFEKREGGAIVLVARHSGRSVCVQVASRNDGAPIHQYDYVGVADQQIELTKVE